MVILFSGMSGIDINVNLSRYSNDYPLFRRFSERKPEILKIDTEIEEVFYSQNPDEDRADKVWTDIILHQSYPVLENLWSKAFDNIFEKVEDIRKDPKKPIFINIHSCYFHNKTREYISLVQIEKLKLLNPKMVITLIDDIYDINHRLEKLGGIYNGIEATSLEMIQRYFRLLDWRSNETLMSRFLANHLGCKNFVFAVKHSHDTFTNLIFEDFPKAYLSHPISEVRRLERKGNEFKADKIKQEITEISEYLTANFTAFLPTTIDEYRIKNEAINKKINTGETIEIKNYFPVLTKRWEEELYQKPKNMLFQASGFKDVNDLWHVTKPKSVDAGVNELLTVLADTISDQVSTRDYTLVEQSDIIIIYRPLFNGNGSGGVFEEFNYFKILQDDLKKEVKCFIYCPQEDINKYYENVFNKKIHYYINVKHLFKQKAGTEFVNITEIECEKLVNNFSKESVIFDILSQVMDNHGIVINSSDNNTPLSKDQRKAIKNNFVKKILDDFSIVDEYDFGSTLFVRQEVTVGEFCNMISINDNKN